MENNLRENVSKKVCTRRAGKLYRARSRLHRSQILQENMRLKALAEIYPMHSFAQLCNLKTMLKSCQNFDLQPLLRLPVLPVVHANGAVRVEAARRLEAEVARSTVAVHAREPVFILIFCITYG